MKVLAMDIGGTYCRLGTFRVKKSNIEMLDIAHFNTSEFENFEDLLLRIQEQCPLKPQDADLSVIALAGPVSADGLRCQPPNISWNLDLDLHRDRKGMQNIVLINDFLAQAWFCVRFVDNRISDKTGDSTKGIVSVLTGRSQPCSSSVVIGAGTGLGTAFIIRDITGHLLASPAEGGHGNFAPCTKEEFELQLFAQNELNADYVIWEHLVSGPGLSIIHKYLTGETLTPQEIASNFSYNQETLEWFSRLYGRAARNYALSLLARGGVYISGGLGVKNPEIVQHIAFEQEFRRSQSHAHVLKEIPVWLVDHCESGLWGCAYCAQSILFA